MIGKQKHNFQKDNFASSGHFTGLLARRIRNRVPKISKITNHRDLKTYLSRHLFLKPPLTARGHIRPGIFEANAKPANKKICSLLEANLMINNVIKEHFLLQEII